MSFQALIKADRAFLTDGGLETTMIFHEGIDLPHFASFVMLESKEGRDALTRYVETHLLTATGAGRGFVLDTPTWRSGLFWTDLLGKGDQDLIRVNRGAAEFAKSFATARSTPTTPIVVNGVIGPAGDGYAPEALHTPNQAREIHAPQIQALGKGGADMISGMTITYPDEAIGIVRASQEIDLPVVISFTVETDGRLPSGQSLPDAMAEVDAATDAYAAFFMVNCAHPDHFSGELAGDWTARIGGVRANASRMSHAELDEAETLDEGDPQEFGALHRDLAAKLPNLRIVGGCCGTDHRHVGHASGCLHHLDAA